MGSRDRLSIIGARQPEVPGGQPWSKSKEQSIRQEQGQEVEQDISRREKRNCGLVDAFEYLGGKNETAVSCRKKQNVVPERKPSAIFT